MRRKVTLALMIALTAMLPLVGQAQRYFGIATSNWSGTNSIYLNPANIADSRHKFTIDLFSLNFGVDNNLATINTGKVTDYVTSSDDNKKLSDAFTFQNRQTFSMMLPYTEVRGPGFMVSLGRKHAIALTSRARIFNQIHDFDQRLYRNVIDSGFDKAQSTYQSGAFNITGHSWGELGLTYAGVIWDGGKHFVKGGFTARYLMGAGYYSLTSNNINVQVFTNPDKTVISNSDINFSSNLNDKIGVDFFSSTGKGIGADLGFVYEFRPKHAKYRYDMDGKTNIPDGSKNKYLLRASVAITDLGRIKYSNNNYIFKVKGTGTVDNGIEDSIATYSDLKAYARKHGFTVDTGLGIATTKVGLPTALVIGLDYHAIGGLYVNATYIGNLADRTKSGNSYYSQITLTPRFDVKAFSFGIPVTYSMLTQSVKAGFGLRAGGFILGSDDVLAAFGGDAYGFNFYMGLSVPINKKKPRDSDGDHVSNRKDKCKHEAGVWEMKGCPNPDKDGDGILDKDDKCPDVAGSKTAEGCPDADLDGVADAEDRCPQESGAPAMQGCPDRDKDGIADVDDACPDVAGLAQYKGCPDTDGDGIADNEDACPNAAGPIANQGCPDTDNDGIADNLDKCPAVPGTQNNRGCPEISVQVKKRLAFAATAIQFDLGKASIKKTSNKLLDEVVKILKDYPDYIMTIDGHTDNVGNPEKNMQLSKDRADAVKNYFITKGISSDRLMSNGYGDTKPVAPNKTAAGRAKNRRVAMDLKLRD